MAATMVNSERIMGAIAQIQSDRSASVRKTRTYNLFDVEDWMIEAATKEGQADELSRSRRARSRDHSPSHGTEEAIQAKQGRRRTRSKTRLLDAAEDSHIPRSKSSSRRLGRRVEGMRRTGSGGALSMASVLESCNSYKNASENSKKYHLKEDEMKQKINRSLGRGGSVRDLREASKDTNVGGMRRIKSSEEMTLTPERRERRRKRQTQALNLPPKYKSASSNKPPSSKNSGSGLDGSNGEDHGKRDSKTNTPDKRRSDRKRLTYIARSSSMPKIHVEEEAPGMGWWGGIVADAMGPTAEEKGRKSSPPTRTEMEASNERRPSMSSKAKLSKKDSRRGKYTKSTSQPDLLMNLQEEDLDGPAMCWQDRASGQKTSRRSSKGKLERRSSLPNDQKNNSVASKQPRDKSKRRATRRSSLSHRSHDAIEDKQHKSNLPSSPEQGRSRARSSLQSHEGSESPSENDRLRVDRASRQNILVEYLRSNGHGQEDGKSLSKDLDCRDLSSSQNNVPMGSSETESPMPSSLERPVQVQNKLFCPPQLRQNAKGSEPRRTTFGRPSLGRPSYSERKLSGLEPTNGTMTTGMRRPKSSAGVLDLKNENKMATTLSSGSLLDLDDEDDSDSSMWGRSKRSAAISFGSGGIVMPAVQAVPNASFGKDKGKKGISKSMLSALSFGVTGRTKTEKDKPVEPQSKSR